MPKISIENTDIWQTNSRLTGFFQVKSQKWKLSGPRGRMMGACNSMKKKWKKMNLWNWFVWIWMENSSKLSGYSRDGILAHYTIKQLPKSIQNMEENMFMNFNCKFQLSVHFCNLNMWLLRNMQIFSITRMSSYRN